MSLLYERDSKKTFYVSTNVWRAFWLLSKSHSTEVNKTSPDELVDDVLRGWIECNHPQLFEHQKQVAKLETELLKTL